MIFYCIRHGQTDWNLKRKIQGHRDIILNEAGRRQAEQLAERMADKPLSQIVSSSLRRAVETAEIIGKYKKMNVDIMEPLKEVDFGCWEGLTDLEIKDQDADLFEQWGRGIADAFPPAGETREQIRKRCQVVTEILLTGKDKNSAIAIISHGAMLANLLSFWLADSMDQSQIMMTNASITTVKYHLENQQFELVELNNREHLY